MSSPTYVHLTVRAPVEDAKRIALAAAIADLSKSAWMLSVLNREATKLVDRYHREAA